MRQEDLDGLLRDVGLRIVEIRLARGWTRDQLSEHFKVTPRYMARIEAGKQNFTMGRLLWLARGLGVRVADLLTPPTIRKIPVGRPRKK